MSKKSLLIAVVLLFMLIAAAMAVENKGAGENFTGQEYLNAKSVQTVSVEGDETDDAGRAGGDVSQVKFQTSENVRNS
ncbi:MAG: hypothetical protein LBU81_00660 [Methanosarcinales archaeon]|nr:hypothetical protein [Methanosarcinales archaeon]